MWQRLSNRVGELEAEAKFSRDTTWASSYRRVAVCGHTNVGKSSFVNALLGANVASVRSRETTALPIMVRYGNVRRRWLRRNGVTVAVGDEIGGETVDDVRDKSWSGFIVDLPRPYLRRYRLIDTAGIGGSIDPAEIYAVVRKCEVALILFNKPDQDMIAPVRTMREIPIIGIRTQADDPVEGADGYDEEREMTSKVLEKAAGEGFPVPFIYVGTQPVASSLGNLCVPALAERLDSVFQFRDVIARLRLSLVKWEQKRAQLEREESSVSVEHAAQIYSAWNTVKQQLDGMQRRRIVALSAQDTAYLRSVVGVPIGRAAWDRIIKTFGTPPFTIGGAPKGQYDMLRDWFDQFYSRSTLDRRKGELELQLEAACAELRVLGALAAALLALELGDRRSAIVLRARVESMSSGHAKLRAIAPAVWEL